MTHLPGPSVAHVDIGQGYIRLDLSAAGHGWYLDPTPLDNTDDFLPTADTTIWRAKAGSAADGKMDMLSVLLHEYGHVLGLDHKPDGGDFMGATLQPGERPLPTADELVWMAQRAAELKAEKEASAHASESGGGCGDSPADPDRPQPAYPAWGTLGTSTRLSRRSPNRSAGGDMGGTAPLPDVDAAAAKAATTQFATAVNATVTNGNFGASGTPNGAGWMAQGDVRFTADGAVLGEGGTRQARLLQGFALGADDKFLSFTVAGPGLAANSAGPNDAFEVALLDADSGQSLAGNLALQGTDALLNRQGDGEFAPERLASTVTRKVNLDGSVSYLVALPASLAGKSALLSFDLLGFADVNSSVTVSDVQLLAKAPAPPNKAPTAADSQATGVEDTALALTWASFNVADPDALPLGRGLQVEIVSLPVDLFLACQEEGSE